MPEFTNVGDLTEFFETTNMGNFDLPETKFDVEIRKVTFLMAVDKALMKKLARKENTSTEALVNSWLEEKADHAV